MTLEKIRPTEFLLKCSAQILSILDNANCSLIISSYSTDQVICLEVKDKIGLNLKANNFTSTYGITYKNGTLASATHLYIIIFEQKKQSNHKKQGDRDIFAPSLTFDIGSTGGIRDLHFDEENNLWAANSAHSCLCTFPNHKTSFFHARWKPFFISNIKAQQDRCHLNGLAMNNGQPQFVTALGQTNEQGAWRKNIMNGGILMNVPDNEIILEGLSIPHTPRIFDEELFVLVSGKGQLLWVDYKSKKQEIVVQLPGFARGMTRCGDYVFIGMSSPKKNASSFGKLEIPQMIPGGGIAVVHLKTGKLEGIVSFPEGILDVYDIITYPNKKFPKIMEPPKLNPAANLTSLFTKNIH